MSGSFWLNPPKPDGLAEGLKLNKLDMSEEEQSRFINAICNTTARIKHSASDHPTTPTRKQIRAHAKRVTRSREALLTAISQGDDIARWALRHLTHLGEIKPARLGDEGLQKIHDYLADEADLVPIGRPLKGWRLSLLWQLADIFDRHGIKPTSGGCCSNYTSVFDHAVIWALDLLHDGQNEKQVKDMTKAFLREWREARKP